MDPVILELSNSGMVKPEIGKIGCGMTGNAIAEGDAAFGKKIKNFAFSREKS
jgi:hypothetical protein